MHTYTRMRPSVRSRLRYSLMPTAARVLERCVCLSLSTLLHPCVYIRSAVVFDIERALIALFSERALCCEALFSRTYLVRAAYAMPCSSARGTLYLLYTYDVRFTHADISLSRDGAHGAGAERASSLAGVLILFCLLINPLPLSTLACCVTLRHDGKQL